MTYSQFPGPGVPVYNSEPPLWAPYYGVPFKVAVQRFFKKYATFYGRASRSEYWWWALVSTVVTIVLNIVAGAGGAEADYSTGEMGGGLIFGSILALLWFLATVIPSIALTVRRLHDANLSGWLLLILLVPFLGALALLVLMVLPPKPEGQRYDRPVAAWA
jgi:uncharacterized membrane protein YhaH (DUF805 family)